MSLKYCQKDCHQDQPVSFFIKENNNWVLCCAMCQYESDLPKQQFTAIKDLEKINKETKTKLESSDIINNLQIILMNVKQWQSQIETLILEIKSQIQHKIDHFSSLIDTLNQNTEFFILNKEKFQEVLHFREQLKENLATCESDIENLQSNLANAYQVLQLASPFQKIDIDIKVPSILCEQENQQGKSNSNSIIKEEKSNNNIPQQIIQEFGQINIDKPNVEKIQEIKQLGKIQINQNEYYEGEIYKGMMHGKGKIVKITPFYESTFEGDFFENKKHGKIIETQIEIETQDMNQSFFKSLSLIKPTNQKKIQLIGEYKNDKKIEVFVKKSYINDNLESQRYQFYEDDVLIEEFD
ncbi:unnamed protein product [Paramecium primaurelia]|uniref:Uncharacterized protein n=1 Tax=Paramecium primaurelia TaxID=5886 RepID=A0A8S1LYN8_PARPR|nr:unnamed protein product [Paramecium primaurelia]